MLDDFEQTFADCSGCLGGWEELQSSCISCQGSKATSETGFQVYAINECCDILAKIDNIKWNKGVQINKSWINRAV
jgi:hypothetical protein